MNSKLKTEVKDDFEMNNLVFETLCKMLEIAEILDL